MSCKDSKDDFSQVLPAVFSEERLLSNVEFQRLSDVPEAEWLADFINTKRAYPGTCFYRSAPHRRRQSLPNLSRNSSTGMLRAGLAAELPTVATCAWNISAPLAVPVLGRSDDM